MRVAWEGTEKSSTTEQWAFDLETVHTAASEVIGSRLRGGRTAITILRSPWVTRFLRCAIFATVSAISAGYAAPTLTPSQDSLIYDKGGCGDSKHASNDILRVKPAGAGRAVLQYSLPPASDCPSVTSATLRLYARYQGEYQTNDFYTNALTTAWSASSATWCSPWSTNGGDWTSEGETFTTIPDKHPVGQNGLYNEWIEWDITDIVNDWISGVRPNYGLIVRQLDFSGGNQAMYFWSSEISTDPIQRPQLVLECGTNPETCNDIDDDGDGTVDEDCNDDGDQYCDANMAIVGLPAICANGGGDCDDSNINRHPGAAELCDELDSDCDATIDEGCPAQLFADAFDRENSNVVGNGWKEIEDLTSSCVAIINEELAIDGQGICDHPAAHRYHGNLQLGDGYIVSMSFKARNSSSRPYYMGLYSTPGVLYHELTGIGISGSELHIRCNALLTSVTNVPLSDGMDHYFWIDYTPNGANAQVRVYTSTNGAKPLSPVLEDLDCEYAPSQLHAMFQLDAPGGNSQRFDDVGITTSETQCDGLDNDANGQTDEGCDDDGDDYCDAVMTTIGTPSVCSNGGSDCNDTDSSINPGTGACVGAWTELLPATSPPLRRDHAIVYDSARDRVVLFGGEGDAVSYLDDTWEWDGANWTNRGPSVKPPGRYSHAMAYDQARNRTVIFGGTSGVEQGDTWVWNGDEWSDVTPASGPSSRDNTAMVYDASRGVVILFGGRSSSNYLDDMWAWDGVSWNEMTPLPKPPARWGHAMAFDGSRGVIVLHGGWGGARLEDTWEWDGSTWTNVTPAIRPAARSYHTLFFDASRGRTVLFGGWDDPNQYFGDTWEWDETQWTEVTPQVSPSPRFDHAMAYDAQRGRGILFGARDATGRTNDTWEYRDQESICDDLDDDGDGTVDEGCDDDSDGYCDATKQLSGTPAICVRGGGDCNDSNLAVHPGIAEICDNVDNNCSSSVDEGCDDDGDDYCDAAMGVSGYPVVCAFGSGDCDDGDLTIYPSALQICDGENNDCDDAIWPSVPPNETDDDSDQYVECLPWQGSDPGIIGGGDCNDADGSINPGAMEVCGDQIDNDCNGSKDANDPGLDGDQDGYGAGSCGRDCDDSDGSVNPGAVDLAGDGTDNDCDGQVDEDTNTISGRAFLGEGKDRAPLAGAVVELQRSADLHIVRTTNTDPASGSFAFNNVSHGSYKVRVQVAWTDPGPSGVLNPNGSLAKTVSKEYSGNTIVGGGDNPNLGNLEFPQPVIFVHGWRAGGCIHPDENTCEQNISAQGSSCVSECDGCRNTWHSMYEYFLADGQ